MVLDYLPHFFIEITHLSTEIPTILAQIVDILLFFYENLFAIYLYFLIPVYSSLLGTMIFTAFGTTSTVTGNSPKHSPS